MGFNSNHKIYHRLKVSVEEIAACKSKQVFDVGGGLYVIKNAGPVALLEERGQRWIRLEALLGSHSCNWQHDVDIAVDRCHLKGCSQHCELSATILNEMVEGG
jgi:hypothetical protein